jgi:hypothetical protein
MPVSSVLRRLRRGSPIVVVSGLPRSGTSMMMRMLAQGGVPILTDRLRQPDAANPQGYFEYEPVKSLADGAPAGWLDQARGRAVKIVSFLLTWLPERYDYQVVFMRRDLREIVASQHDMLAGREEQQGPDAERLIDIYARHLEEVGRFLAARACFRMLDVEHARVIASPPREARRVAQFLGRRLDERAMAAAVDARLYRHRHG